MSVNWQKIEEGLMGKLDLNHDGKVDGKDASFLFQKTVSILSSNMAATGTGFTAGFLYGLKKG